MKKLAVVVSALSLFVVAQGCALNGQEAVEQDPSTAQSAEAVTVASDAVIKAKLAELIGDASFTSESDYGYVVLEGTGGRKVSRLGSAVLRSRLAAAIQAQSSDHRNIRPLSVRSERNDINQAIADAEEGAADETSEEDPYRNHDRKLAATLKYMKKNLRASTGYSFGMNASGDQDEFGTVVHIWVGFSKTTGKLIAIMTEAVYT